MIWAQLAYLRLATAGAIALIASTVTVTDLDGGRSKGYWQGAVSVLLRLNLSSELGGMGEHPGAAPGSAANKAGLCWRLAPP